MRRRLCQEMGCRLKIISDNPSGAGKTIFRRRALNAAASVFNLVRHYFNKLLLFAASTPISLSYGFLPLLHAGSAVTGDTMSGTSSPPPAMPSLPWRFTSSVIMGLTGSLSRGFLYGLNRIEVVGLDRFLETLDKREDIDGRERGLITGLSPGDACEKCADRFIKQYQIMSACTSRPAHTNDILYSLLTKCLCRMDDPLIWGVLPFRYAFNPANHRWSLGSYDICFQNRFANACYPRFEYRLMSVCLQNS